MEFGDLPGTALLNEDASMVNPDQD
jgi:hypothetical protein